MKKYDYSEHIERYIDCPYCSTLISDDKHAVNFFPGEVISCPHCLKDIQLGECN